MIFIKDMQEARIDGFFKKRISYKISYPKRVDLSSNELIFEYDVENIEAIGDSAIFSLLPVAFWEKQDISVDERIPCSENIQQNVDKICDAWNRFFDYSRKVNISGGKLIDLKANPSLKSGLLFSGGIDSLASYIEKEAEIGYLLYCYGADVHDWSKFKKIADELRIISESLGKKMIFYSTNIQKLTTVSWLKILHGCAIVGPALTLSKNINKIIVSSSHTYEIAENYPCGSSPLTDKYISNNSVATEHFGNHLNRIDKIKLVLKYPALLSGCRVCSNLESLNYNCGYCEKCVRTMLPLLLMKVPADQTPFPKALYSIENVLKNIESIKKYRLGVKLVWSEMIAAIKNDEFDLSDSEKESIERRLLQRFGSFYEGYINRHDNSGFFKQFLVLSPIRKIERLIGFNADSLEFLHSFEHKLRRFYYYIKGNKK